ncbi:hypothetical protein B0T11DRAFT_81076 [Plectosphaerella cucumerina]|uniref:Uncharacterized protein n=1 Tax=Plectosphaerella cucumerina TaxID=40658 RepID=A0A8K0TGP5_9PEZI|nr:hypothetical protein B0T11DRAFT_81076 [Plectosphaerella cucumerina]
MAPPLSIRSEGSLVHRPSASGLRSGRGHGGLEAGPIHPQSTSPCQPLVPTTRKVLQPAGICGARVHEKGQGVAGRPSQAQRIGRRGSPSSIVAPERPSGLRHPHRLLPLASARHEAGSDAHQQAAWRIGVAVSSLPPYGGQGVAARGLGGNGSPWPRSWCALKHPRCDIATTAAVWGSAMGDGTGSIVRPRLAPEICRSFSRHGDTDRTSAQDITQESSQNPHVSLD